MNEKLDQIKRVLRRWFAPGATHRSDLAKVGQLTKGIVTTRSDEIDCGECFERLDWFAEAIQAGMSPSHAMPLVQDHVERCPDCKQEFLALMKALQADTNVDAQRARASWPVS